MERFYRTCSPGIGIAPATMTGKAFMPIAGQVSGVNDKLESSVLGIHLKE